MARPSHQRSCIACAANKCLNIGPCGPCVTRDWERVQLADRIALAACAVILAMVLSVALWST